MKQPFIIAFDHRTCNPITVEVEVKEEPNKTANPQIRYNQMLHMSHLRDELMIKGILKQDEKTDTYRIQLEKELEQAAR